MERCGERRRLVGLGRVVVLGALLWGVPGACGGAAETVRPTPTANPGETQVASPTDQPSGHLGPLGDFRGPRVKAGEAFELGDGPVGVEGVGVVLTLIKVHETEYQEPGRPKVVETAAEILVQRGAETRNVRIDQGDTKTRLGARIKVERAATDYVEERADYLARATVVVTAVR